MMRINKNKNKMIIKTYAPGYNRICLGSKGLVSGDILVKYLKTHKGVEYSFKNDTAITTTTRAMIREDKGFTIKQLYACIAAGGVFKRIQELENERQER